MHSGDVQESHWRHPWLTRPITPVVVGETMRRLLIAAPAALACSAAHAEFAANTPGQWMDVRNRIAVGELLDSSEPVARLNYAKPSALREPEARRGRPKEL
jgi:hypothetical protein